jgi:tRNA 2-selenouridine synthase
MAWRELSVQQFNEMKNALLIDVRSPCEHVVEAIPGSLNIPLLSDDERAEVGTIYKQQGDLIARRHALSLISPKIPQLVESIASLRKHGQSPVIYCWRGGLRSEAVSSVLSIAGVDCFRLSGGYKAWRASVIADFTADRYPFQAVVLVGLTGTGKTDILREIARKGASVLDLEALANHRGSVFGGLGLGEQPTQKNFDAALWAQLRELPRDMPVFLEGESRKVGRIALPDCVFARIQKGTHVLVTGSLEKRAERITQDYLNPERSPDQALAQALILVDHLRERLGNKMVDELKHMLSTGSVTEAVRILLSDYYDPLYNKQIERCSLFALQLDGDDVPSAANRLMAWAHESRQLAV